MCSVWAHGERPRVTHLSISPSYPDSIFALTDTQGIFADLKRGFSWLCEDAVHAGAATRGILVSGDRNQHWLIATADGLFTSDDRGCNFSRVAGPLSTHDLAGLWTHPDTPTLFTAGGSVPMGYDVFRSPGHGQGWTALGLALTGRIRTLLWSRVDADRLYVHHRDGILRSVDDGNTFTALEVRIGAQEIPSVLIHQLVVSPTRVGLLLAIVESGDQRSRILRTTDDGDSWSDVGLLPSTSLTTVFHNNGRYVMSIDPFGGLWRSRDEGLTWYDAPRSVTALNCLRMKPNSEALYGCSDPNAGGPWVIGESSDFGETWTPLLTQFEAATHRDDCAPTSQHAACCRGLCPGDQAAGMCGQPDLGLSAPLCQSVPDAQVVPTDGRVAVFDASLPDRALPDMFQPSDSTSSGVERDIGQPRDQGFAESVRDGGRRHLSSAPSATGCMASGFQYGPTGHYSWLIVLLLLFRARVEES